MRWRDRPRPRSADRTRTALTGPVRAPRSSAPPWAAAPAVKRGVAWQWPYLQMMLMAAAGFTSFAATLSALPVWEASRGASPAAAGAVTTIMLAATVACQPLVPALLRKVSTPTAVAVGLLALGLPALVLLTAPSAPVLYAVCVVRGFGFAVFTVASALLTSEIAPPHRHGHVTGLYGLAAAVPNLIFVPLSVLIFQQVGFGPVALMAGLVPVLGAPFGWLRFGQAVPRRAVLRRQTSIRAALRSPLAPAVVLCTVTIISGAFVTILPIEQGGYVATVGLLVYGVVGALSRWQVGRWSDRVGITKPLILSCFVAVVGVATLAVGLTLQAVPGTLLGSGLIGAAFGSVQSLTLVSAFARSSEANRPLASTIWNVAFDAGTAIGAVLIGTLSDLFNLWAACGVLGVLVVAAIPAAAASGRTTSASCPTPSRPAA